MHCPTLPAHSVSISRLSRECTCARTPKSFQVQSQLTSHRLPSRCRYVDSSWHRTAESVREADRAGGCVESFQVGKSGCFIGPESCWSPEGLDQATLIGRSRVVAPGWSGCKLAFPISKVPPVSPASRNPPRCSPRAPGAPVNTLLAICR
jgi:hypothetical protein